MPVLELVMVLLLALVLAMVAARVVGETGIPPIGALGKIAQLGTGSLAPGLPAANLMGANVTGGAAGQTADLLNDLKAGALLNAAPAPLFAAQLLGVAVGSIAGTASYLLLIPDPAAQLLTPEWPAPAVATWKAVAEVMAGGLAALPPLSVTAAVLGALAGLLLACWQHRAPARLAAWAPSASAAGLAFVIPAWIAFGLCLGALAARLLEPLVQWGRHAAPYGELQLAALRSIARAAGSADVQELVQRALAPAS